MMMMAGGGRGSYNGNGHTDEPCIYDHDMVLCQSLQSNDDDHSHNRHRHRVDDNDICSGRYTVYYCGSVDTGGYHGRDDTMGFQWGNDADAFCGGGDSWRFHGGKNSG